MSALNSGISATVRVGFIQSSSGMTREALGSTEYTETRRLDRRDPLGNFLEVPHILTATMNDDEVAFRHIPVDGLMT